MSNVKFPSSSDYKSSNSILSSCVFDIDRLVKVDEDVKFLWVWVNVGVDCQENVSKEVDDELKLVWVRVDNGVDWLAKVDNELILVGICVNVRNDWLVKVDDEL